MASSGIAIVDGALDELAPVEFLVQADQQEPQHRGEDEGDGGGCAAQRHGHDVPGPCGAGEHVTRKDRAGVGDGVDGGNGGRAFGRGPGQRVGDPAQTDDVARVDAGDHEHHGEIARRRGRRGGGKDEGDDREVQGAGNVEVAFARAVGVPGVDERGDDGQDVGGAGQQQRIDFRVA